MGGCYIEPEPKPWTGDQTRALACHLEEGGAAIEVTADLPIYCASLAANIHDAASQLGIPPQALSGLTVHIQDADCRRGGWAGGGGNGAALRGARVGSPHMRPAGHTGWCPDFLPGEEATIGLDESGYLGCPQS